MKRFFEILVFLFVLTLSLTLSTPGQGTPGTVRFPALLDTADSLITAANRAQTTLGGAISNFDTSMTVPSTTGFPSTGILTIENELIIYTGKTGTSFTGLVRGAFGTSAASHTSGRPVRMNVTAEYHNTLVNALIPTQAKLGYSSSTP